MAGFVARRSSVIRHISIEILKGIIPRSDALHLRYPSSGRNSRNQNSYLIDS